MKNFTLIVLFFLTAFTSFGQATSSGSTLTITNVAGTVVYYEYNISLTGAFINSTGAGAPLNTPIKIKITSSGTNVNPYFVAGDLNGACDTFLVGSMNSTNTEFTTTLNSCCGSIAEGFANGLRFGIPIKCVTPIGGNCITYNFSTVCDVYCASFYLPSNNALCRTKNYTVQIGFTDGTSTSIVVNFASNNTVFCFLKPISGIISSNLSNCTACGISPEKKVSTSEKTDSSEIDEIIVSPNPTKSILNFTGKDLGKYNLSIFDVQGKSIIKNLKMNSEINIENLVKGIYFYVIKDDNGFKQEGKIFKE